MEARDTETAFNAKSDPKIQKKTQSTPGSESDWDKTHTHRNIQIHFGLRCTMEITAITHVSVIC